MTPLLDIGRGNDQFLEMEDNECFLNAQETIDSEMVFCDVAWPRWTDDVRGHEKPPPLDPL